MTYNPKRELAAIFLFSAALLSIELNFTKFFSIVMWYHFGFLIVSTAMLGFSAAGIYLSLKQNSTKLSLYPLIVTSAIFSAVSYILMTRVYLFDFTAHSIPARIAEILIMVVLLFIPFFFIGLVISWVMTNRKEKIGLYYGANLIGSAVGAPLFILIFNSFNGQIAAVINILLMLLSALFLIDTGKRAVLWCSLFAALFISSFFPVLFPMEPPKDKILGLVHDRANDVVYTGWSSLSKVDFVKDPDRSIYPEVGMWGINDRYKAEHGKFPERMAIVIDSWAYTNLMKYPQDLGFYDYLPTTFVYHLGNTFKRSLHIGAGGGMDLLAAKYYGVKDITGIEINPVIVSAVRNQFKDYSGGIYSGAIPEISIVTDEGRHFVEQSAAPFDVIQLSGVDTFSSTQAGAFALSENNLYTTEAFKSYFNKLTPNGMFTMTGWFSPDSQGRFRYCLKLLNIAKESMVQAGMNPDISLMFFVAKQYTLLTIKKGAFTQAEIEAGKAYINQNGFSALIIPGEKLSERSYFEKFLRSDMETYKKLLDDYPYNVSAPTDDKPFYFELRKFKTSFMDTPGVVVPLSVFSGQTILFIVLFELIILGFFLLLIPLRILSKRETVKLKPGSLIYFSLIGFAFMLVEIVLSQKLVLYLGHPTYSLSIVLFSMLLFSGLGSVVSEKIFQGRRVFILPVIMLLEIIFVTPILGATLSASLAFRVAVTLLFIGPLAFLMGMPFPSWLRTVKNAEVPFLWGINGFFSVIGSVLAVIISINLGFTFVFYIALAAYTVAMILFMIRSREIGDDKR